MSHDVAAREAHLKQIAMAAAAVGRAARCCGRVQAADDAARAGARRLSLCQRQDHDSRRQELRHRPDVCRDPRAGAADASLSDHHGAWRHDVRRAISPARRTAAKAGRSISCARATPSMSSISRARPLGLSAGDLRAGAQCRAQQFGVALRRRRRSSSSGRRPRCTPNGRAAATPDDPATLQVDREPTAGDRELRQAAVAQCATR